MLVTKESSNTYTWYNIHGKEKTFFINNNWKYYNLGALVLRVPSNNSFSSSFTFPLKTEELFWHSLGVQHDFASSFPWGMSQYFKAWEDRDG